MKLIDIIVTRLKAVPDGDGNMFDNTMNLPDPDGKPADMSKPVKVFIIMGQPNTLEMGNVKGDKASSLEKAIKEEGLNPFMVDDAGNWTKRMDVRNVHTQGSGGPEGRRYAGSYEHAPRRRSRQRCACRSSRLAGTAAITEAPASAESPAARRPRHQ